MLAGKKRAWEEDGNFWNEDPSVFMLYNNVGENTECYNHK